MALKNLIDWAEPCSQNNSSQTSAAGQPEKTYRQSTGKSCGMKHPQQNHQKPAPNTGCGGGCDGGCGGGCI